LTPNPGGYPQVRGATLWRSPISILPRPTPPREAKRLMREVLDHYLEQRAVFSRRVVRDLRSTRKPAGNRKRPC
jgi:hypothetical protein